jgi:hypothetical protein
MGDEAQDTHRAQVQGCTPLTPALAVPAQFFVYVGPADVKGNSLYRCVKCTRKIISCNDVSRHNLKKHVMVSKVELFYFHL